MKEFYNKTRDQVVKFFSGLTTGQRGRLIALVGAVVVLGVFVAVMLGRTEYSVLYTNLDADEAGDILTKLEEYGVSARTENSDTILVPSDDVSELRMRLASDGYGSGSTTPDIFAEASGVGTTDLEKQTYLRYQIQNDLRTTIMKMDKVDNAAVNLYIASDTTYVLATEAEESTASVLLELTSGASLSSSDVDAIANMVASAVSGLTPENVTIVDTDMNYYTVGSEDFGTSSGVSQQLDLQNQVQSQLENQVETLLAPVYGDSVKASVYVRLNFDKETVSAVTFEPVVDDEGIAVSLYELYESQRTGDDAGGVVGTDSNMGTTGYVYEGLDDDETYSKVVREVNYELNETQQLIERAQGTIEDLSIGILIDETAASGGYARSVRNLVSSALGIEADMIAVEQLPFQDASSDLEDAIAAQEEYMATLQQRERFRLAAIALLVVVGAVVVLLMVRYIVKGMASRPRMVEATANGAPVGVDYMADEDLEPQGEPDTEKAVEELEINMKSSPVTRLERMVEQDPEAVAQLLRNWLTDD